MPEALGIRSWQGVRQGWEQCCEISNTGAAAFRGWPLGRGTARDALHLHRSAHYTSTRYRNSRAAEKGTTAYKTQSVVEMLETLLLLLVATASPVLGQTRARSWTGWDW